LINDIDLSNYDASNPWEPIGDSVNPFEGNFDGNNHTISNLYVNTHFSNEYLGLFGYVRDSGSIKNVKLENAYVEGDYQVGALVGYVNGGTFENITVTGSVYGWEDEVGGVIGYSENSILTNVKAEVYVEGYDNVGGITGYSINDTVSGVSFGGEVKGSHYYIGGLFGIVVDGTIRNSSSTGSVSGHQYIGGLAGALDHSTISRSYSHADVSNTDDDMGGLIGNSMFSHIEYSYAAGEVMGEDDLGGLVGYSEETTIAYSYATGNVIGGDDVGGLVGDNEGGIISHSFATGNVDANGEYVGGLVGDNEEGFVKYSYSKGLVSITSYSYVGGLVGSNSNGNVVGSYYDTGTSGQSDNLDKGLGLASPAMKIVDSYVNWDFDSIWKIDAHNNGYPYFRSYITYVSNDADPDGERTNRNAYILNSPLLVIGNDENWGMLGFLFRIWNTERDGTGISYSEGDTISSNTSILLYAIWVEGNEKLSGLSLSEGASLSPTFSENVTSYTANVANRVSSIKVIPDLVSSNSTATVAINDEAAQPVRSGEESSELTLDVGVNTIKVVVTAVDGTTTRTYTVTVTRGNSQDGGTPSLSSNANIKNLSLDIGEQLDAEFSSDTLSYALNVDHGVHHIRITPTLADNKATVELQMNDITYVVKSGSESSELPINRAEMAALIARVMNWPKVNITFSTFSDDESIPEWAKGHAQAALEHGVLVGRLNNTFVPFGRTTRAEAAVVMLRLHKIL
jgi:hypothetical protein